MKQNNVRVLGEKVINQIAAGEVIENPASVVKELIENSLDAGAKKIWVEIRGGGFQLIRVADDGVGMSRDGAILCFERYATSKITCIEDLSTLCSMGFRGEALASIAAVSQADLVTAEEGQDATEVEVEGGVIRGVRPASRSRGTTLSVRSLFYNVPARKKFQKPAATTTAEIHKLLFSFALAYPDVGFELVVGESLLLSAAPEDELSFLFNLEQRIEKIFDGTFLQGRRSLACEKSGYELKGWIGSPADDRINRSGQYLFVNQRAVTSPLIAAAVKAGYGHRLNERRHPIFVLHLTVPPEEMDVNVHPQKREVRFQNEEWLRQFVQSATRAAFEQTVAASTSFQEQAVLPPIAPLRFRENGASHPPTWIDEPVVIGLFEHYLLIEDEGMIWVDLQKARELILLRSLQTQTPNAQSQGLLIPIPLALSKEQQQELQEKQTVLQAIGFSVEMSGKDHFLIHALPTFIEAEDAVEAIQCILDGEEVFKNIAAFAVRRKKRFMIQEALALWHQVKELSDPAVVTKIGRDVIKNFFK